MSFKIEIREIPNTRDSFKRRVSEKYVIQRFLKKDELVKKKGLHSSIIIPEQYNNKLLTINYKVKVINLSKDNLEEKINKSFKQKAVKRMIIPEKSRNYHNKNEWMYGTSPKGLYTTIICPKELAGKIVKIRVSKD